MFTFRSNLPKEIMELSGFPHKGVGDACYFPAAYILKYLNDFTDHFNLRQYIKVCRIIELQIEKNSNVDHVYTNTFVCSFIIMLKQLTLSIMISGK